MTRRREYMTQRSSISFKTATIIVIGLHCVGAFGVFVWNKRDKTPPAIVAKSNGPRSDALRLNTKPTQIKTLPYKPTENKPTVQVVLNPSESKQIIPRPTEYTLTNGDNLYSVCRKLGISFSKVLEYNGLTDPRQLRVGQILKVPQDS